ncbi:Tpn1 protein [Martiniozyma asiatica (nom. inval.)]|nr:Tpn1 protein [Martiniozyma asiatica]
MSSLSSDESLNSKDSNKFSKYSVKVYEFLNIESKGIHRYLPEERHPVGSIRPYFTACLLWVSGCGGLTSMSSFFFGPLLFNLPLKDALSTGLTGTLFGCLIAAYCSMMGPMSGLRQMCSARYLFGPWVRVVALITVVGFWGWSITNCVLGGEILQGFGVNLLVGVAIVGIVSCLIAVLGIGCVMKFEGALGVTVIIVVCCFWGMVGKEIGRNYDVPNLAVGEVLMSGKISFFTLAYSVTATWGGCAGDYYVVFGEVSQWAIFVFTFFSIAIPTVFGGALGIMVGYTALGYDQWGNAYAEGSLGGLLNTIFDKWGNFGKFLLIVFWLSLVTNNVINTYSSSLAVQLLDPLCYKYLPRWLISFIIGAITLVCSMVGKDHFSAILSNFLPMLGYWISIYFTLLFEENVIFRSTRLVKLFKAELYGIDIDGNRIEDIDETGVRVEKSNGLDKAGEYSISGGSLSSTAGVYPPPLATTKSVPYYNFDAWDNASVQTRGFASSIAFCCGVAGAVVGMSQVYFIGPISKLAADADLGTFLSIGFTAVSYPVLRYIELKKFGR